METGKNKTQRRSLLADLVLFLAGMFAMYWLVSKLIGGHFIFLSEALSIFVIYDMWKVKKKIKNVKKK